MFCSSKSKLLILAA